MALRKCPICGASVKLENLERHVASVHPREHPDLSLSARDRLAIRDSRRRPQHASRFTRRTLALALFVPVVTLAVLFGVASLSSMPPGGPIHWHPHLTIVIDNQTVTVPADIGIDPSLWVAHSLDSYGMSGMAPLHTHDASGTIHVESNVYHAFTIGDFFRIWGETFDPTEALGHAAASGHHVWMVVNGVSESPSYGVVLQDQMQIEIVCGFPG